MFFSISLYLSLAICAAGLVFKIWSWLTVSIDKDDEQYSPGQRLKDTLAEMGGVIASRRVWTLLKALLLDGFLQRRSLAHSYAAWLAHICIFAGFTWLALFHAMGWLTEALFGNYYPTVEPWLFLRDLFGVVVMLGVGLMIYRRLRVPGLRMTTRATDRIAIVFLAVVLVSGFALQALKITSTSAFEQMQTEYAMLDKPEELLALRSVWADRYGVVFPAGQTSLDPQVLAQGRQLNEDSCVSCHAPAQHAFASYALSVALRPAALVLDRSGGVDVLYHLHFLTLFVGVALLPFTKFLHMLSGPLLLATNAVVDRQTMRPAARAALRALEMDACSHCGTCTVHCSVAVSLHRLHNQNILPSEKLSALGEMVHGHNGASAHLAQITEGAYVCTDCYRCTRLCPLGINLNDLWVALKRNLANAGFDNPVGVAARQAMRAAQPSRQKAVKLAARREAPQQPGLAGQIDAFAECYTCQQCTNACPLVFMSTDPRQELDLLPHQVIYALKLGLFEEATGARMVWNCLTCYQCQESCPNNIQVTDIFYELRNEAAKAAGVQES
ncbi:MAG: 4Fe-4S dicluster domain-containing protein [Pseudomonadota bacterium]